MEPVRELTLGRTQLTIEMGDITIKATDAIVNAANVRLSHGGGVAKAISDKGGPGIQKLSDEYIRLNGQLATADAVILSGCELRCKWVIHAVGPIYKEEKEPNLLLSQCVKNILIIAEESRIQTLAIPAISSGIYGFPLKDCAEIMLETIKKYFEDVRESCIKHVFIVIHQERKDTFTEFCKVYTRIKHSARNPKPQEPIRNPKPQEAIP